MERQSKESRGLEAHCRGGQGPPRAVAPSGGGGGQNFGSTMQYRHKTVLASLNEH
jgi:hypothetical protein